MIKIYIGIDTSNYTTSISAVTSDNEYFNIKEPLFVELGKIGVRQSDAVFLHTKNFPIIADKLFSVLREKYNDNFVIKAIGVSSRPRPIENSYMPCFMSGVAFGESFACLLNVPIFKFSHQEGHIRSSLLGAGVDVPNKFYSFHLSGGTCELLESKKTEDGFASRIISSSLDITLGQLVDRVGVMLGLKFPAGHLLEELAHKSDKKYKINIVGKENINLSGFENKAQQMYEASSSSEDIASYIYSVILAAIERMLENRKDKSLPVVFAGGVSGSKILQEYVKNICDAYFAPPSLSSDNAVGISVLTKEKFEKVSVNV